VSEWAFLIQKYGTFVFNIMYIENYKRNDITLSGIYSQTSRAFKIYKVCFNHLNLPQSFIEHCYVSSKT